MTAVVVVVVAHAAAVKKEAVSSASQKGTAIKVAEAIGRGAAVVTNVLESLTHVRKRRSS